MKYFNYSICLFILCLSLFACKKSNDQPSVKTIATNWGEDLKGTIWAGDFKYTTGAYLGSQPFSMDLKEDGTIMWYDVTSERAGGTWTVKDSTVTFTFPSNTSFHATVAKDKWSNLTMDPSSGFLINSISRSARPDPAMLAGTGYSGIFDVYIMKLNISSSNVLDLHYGSSGFQYGYYSISGGGIRFINPGSPFDDRYYLLVQDNYTVLKGVNCIFGINPRSYSSLSLTKN